MYELKVISKFSAAHQLKMVTKKCENLHGHNWKVEVCVSAKDLNHAGVVMDFGEIKKQLSEIMNTLDHQFLNEIDCFKNSNPSSEIIAKHIADELQVKISNPLASISRVSVWESDDSCATYIVG